MVFKGVMDKKPKKSDNGKYAILSQPWNLTFFENEIFNFFFNHMVQKYQNEIAPIFYYGKSPKTNEKDPKIPFLQPPDWGQPYWMTRYLLSTLLSHHTDSFKDQPILLACIMCKDMYVCIRLGWHWWMM